MARNDLLEIHSFQAVRGKDQLLAKWIQFADNFVEVDSGGRGEGYFTKQIKF